MWVNPNSGESHCRARFPLLSLKRTRNGSLYLLKQLSLASSHRPVRKSAGLHQKRIHRTLAFGSRELPYSVDRNLNGRRMSSGAVDIREFFHEIGVDVFVSESNGTNTSIQNTPIIDRTRNCSIAHQFETTKVEIHRMRII